KLLVRSRRKDVCQSAVYCARPTGEIQIRRGIDAQPVLNLRSARHRSPPGPCIDISGLKNGIEFIERHFRAQPLSPAEKPRHRHGSTMRVVIEYPGLKRIGRLSESAPYHVVAHLESRYSGGLEIDFAAKRVVVITAARQQQENV